MTIDVSRVLCAASGVGVLAAAVLVSENALLLVADPGLEGPMLHLIAVIGLLASAAGAVLSFRRRDLRVGLVATGAAASLVLVPLTGLGVATVVEAVRFMAPLALLASILPRELGRSRFARVADVTLALASLGWLLGLTSPVPVPFGLFLASQIVALWAAFALVAEPVLEKTRRLAIGVIRGDVTW